MSPFTTDAPAIALGAAIGAAAGLRAPRVVSLAQAKLQDGEHPGNGLPRAAAALIVALAGAAGALIGVRFGLHARLPAYLYLTAIAPALGAVDAVTRTLPNRILLPAYPLAVSLLGIAAWQADDWKALLRALVGAALLFAIFLVVALATPSGSLGWGDVKLAGLLGLFLGYLGWATLRVGMMIAFGSAAAYVLASTAMRRPRDRHLSLGPALLFGALAAVIVS